MHSKLHQVGWRESVTGKHVLALAVLSLIQFGLLSWASFRLSPTPDEVPHLCAGLDYLETGNFELYNVNPPLVKVLAAWPAYCRGMRVPLDVPMADAYGRPEWHIGEAFAERHPQRAWTALVAGRHVAAAFAVLGMVGVFALAQQCFGPWSGLAAAALWAFSPWTMGYGGLLTMDVPGAAVGAVAAAAFVHWLSHSTLLSALNTAIWTALAILTKFTALLLVPAFLIWWAVHRWSASERAARWGGAAAIVLILGLSWLLVCAGYHFNGVFRPLGQYRFVSASLADAGHSEGTSAAGSDNRFTGTLLGKVPVPLPQAMIEGIDTQRKDFETPHAAFLWGRWQEGGWWYYYLVGLFLKTPVAMLVLIGVGTAAVWRRPDVWVPLVLIPALLLAAISVQTNLNRHLRYAIPVLPFLCVVASGAFTLPWGRFAAWCRRGLLAAACLLPLAYHPYCLGYVNWAAGGPRFADRYLAHSSLDWDQGWIAARDWLRQHAGSYEKAVTPPLRWNYLPNIGLHTTKVDLSELFAEDHSGPVLLVINVAKRMELEHHSRERFPAERRVARLDAGIEMYRLMPQDARHLSSEMLVIEPKEP